jgi:hypothetical protein
MPVQPTPLEKQLVNIDLSKGVDERQRAELFAGVTTLDNLVCDQSGCWVKRPGTDLGPASDASGTATYPSLPKKILALLTGWGCIADVGRLLHKQDSQATFRARQYHMDFSTNKAYFVGASGPVSQSLTVGSSVKCAASCSTHDAYVSQGVTGLKDKLSICEHATGTEYVYDLGQVTYPAGGLSGGGAQAVFVSDRYLHVFVASPVAATVLSVVVIDVLAAMPANEAAITAFNVTTLGAGTVLLFDAVGGTVSSFVLFGNSGGQSNLYQLSSNGAVQDSVNFAADVYSAMDVDEVSTNVWLMVPGAATKFVAQWCLGVSINNVAAFTSPNPGTLLSCNTTTHDVRILYAFSATLGGTTIDSIEVLNLANAAVVTTVVGSAYGWTVCSKPFFLANTGRHYVQLTKYDTLSEISSHVMCDISTFTPFWSNNAGLANPFGSFRNAGNIEPYFGLKRFGSGASLNFNTIRYRSYDGAEVSVCVPYQAAQRVEGITFHRLRMTDHTAYGAANFAGSTHIAHGGLNSYDGRDFTDLGFSDMPIVNSVTPGATPGNLNGAYRYVAVFRRVDANGVASYSRTFGPVAATNVAAATGKNNITIQPHGVTNGDIGNFGSMPFVELYRTKSGGTQFYLCASSQASMTASTTPLVQQLSPSGVNGLLTVTDNLSDTNLGSQPIMFRQPGTPNSPVDRYTAPSCKHVIQHKDRLFCTDPYGQRVFYSSFFVDGEAPWFNPAFNFFVHHGTGPITGLASMDGRLFIFKRDAIFVVDGDGPTESGPNGSEFSQPQYLASRYGCLDHRSIVLTPNGIMYRSTRGIEMLERNLKVSWVGERVQNTVNANPIVTGACMDKDARVRMTLAPTEAAYGGAYNTDGCEIVYDTSADAWSVARYTGLAGVYGRSRQNVGVIQSGGVEYVAYADDSSGVFISNELTSFIDFVYYAPFKLETGWIKQGPQARQRITDILFLAKKQAAANHALKMSIAYNYSDTYTQSHTWEPSELNALSVEELNLQPTTQQVLAIRVKIEDQAPADTVTYPVGTGAGCDILAVTAEVAAKQGAPKLATVQKA